MKDLLDRCACIHLYSNVLKQHLCIQIDSFIDGYIKQCSNDKCSQTHKRLVYTFRSHTESQGKGYLSLINRPGGGKETNLVEIILDGGTLTTHMFCSSSSKVPGHYLDPVPHQPHPTSSGFALNFDVSQVWCPIERKQILI